MKRTTFWIGCDSSLIFARSFKNASVTVIPWQMTISVEKPAVELSRQVLAYCHAIENFGAAFRWMACIDIDEYIVPKADRSICDALSSLVQFSSISLPWTMFGTNGHICQPLVAAPYAFTNRTVDRPRQLLEFKCIFDPCEVLRMRVHAVRTASMGDQTANDVGLVAPYRGRSASSFISDTRIQLNHYYTRAQYDLNQKLTKGGVSGFSLEHRRRSILDKVEHIDGSTVEDRSAIEFIERHGIYDPESFSKIGLA